MHNLLGKKEIKILSRLIEHGYEAMIVGGATRDYLLGKRFNDVDIATNAPYDELVKIMEDLGELKLVGKAFGVLMVGGIEVATYRTDNYIGDNGAIIETQPASCAYEDSKRRDFTINAIYYDYATHSIHDFQKGYRDLQKSILKTVGNPYERFTEDYSRILRALYLAASLNLTIEEKTAQAIRDLGYKLAYVHGSLQGKIIYKVIKKNAFSKFLRLLKEFDLVQYVFPDMEHTIGLKQNPKYHKYDVWDHTLTVIESAERFHRGNIAMIMGAFLHDNAKGTPGVRGISNTGQPNDIGHEKAGVFFAKQICNRLEFPRRIKKDIVMLVEWHGSKIAPTEKSVKKFLLKFKNKFTNLEDLINGFKFLTSFMLCDADGFSDELRSEVVKNTIVVKTLATTVFEKQIFYSNQFNFEASLIARHKNVKLTEVTELIEFFIRNNISDKQQVLNILNRRKP